MHSARLRRDLAVIAALLAGLVAGAKEAAPLADDPALQARVLHVAEELRCLVCQNETLAASHADLAVDLRNQIRLQLLQGRSEDQIRDYMVQRYGDFVLYRPPLKERTLLLWLGPFALLVVAAGALMWQIRRRRGVIAAHPLSAADAQRARALLGDDEASGA